MISNTFILEFEIFLFLNLSLNVNMLGFFEIVQLSKLTLYSLYEYLLSGT